MKAADRIGDLSQQVIAGVPTGLSQLQATSAKLLLMIQILHYLLKDPNLWALWYIPYYEQGRISIINRMTDLPKPQRGLWGQRAPDLSGLGFRV